MHVSACGHVAEEDLGEAEGEGVAHCVDEDVGGQKGEGVPGEDERPEGLAGESEARPCGGENPMAGGEIEEVNGRRVEVDVEAVLTDRGQRWGSMEWLGSLTLILASIAALVTP